MSYKHGRDSGQYEPPRVGAFLDGCHKYGWLITLLTLLVSFAYFMGGLSKTVEDLKTEMGSRITRLEQTVYSTRGLPAGFSLPDAGDIAPCDLKKK